MAHEYGIIYYHGICQSTMVLPAQCCSFPSGTVIIDNTQLLMKIIDLWMIDTHRNNNILCLDQVNIHKNRFDVINRVCFLFIITEVIDVCEWYYSDCDSTVTGILCVVLHDFDSTIPVILL